MSTATSTASVATTEVGGFKRAAIYVRVSSEQQVNRNRRGDDGYSIPAQTQACQRKAEELGAVADAELQPLFEKLLDPALPAHLGVPGRRQGRRTQEHKNRGPVSVAHGLKENDLVELMRLLSNRPDLP